VHPGTVLPEEHSTAEDVRKVVEEAPLRRMGDPSDASRAIRYLLEAPFVTGEELIVDGGRSIR
jgi:pteridine reductase